ncbi:PQQ-like beta-propeller repeat protein [Streptomyces sp. NBC_01537]|uniref:outer membrane protein assembly factor BamB family protein n=1 Tax=Streptomyces sp. NBC_01537 TaxID=2903896 RepID=UPI0038669464
MSQPPLPPPYEQPPHYAPLPPRGGNGKLIGVVVASAVALVAVVGGVLGAASDDVVTPKRPQVGPIAAHSQRGSGSGGNAIPAGLLWTKSGALGQDAWFTGNAIVEATPDAVVSHDIDSGHENWSVPLSGEPCPAARKSPDDRIVVPFGAGCARLMAIDIAKGAVLWTAKVAANCGDVGSGGGSEPIAVIQCGTYLQGISASGDRQWSWAVPSHSELSAVISTDPVVVGLSAGRGSPLSEVVFLEDGREKSRIPLGSPGAEGYAVDSDTLYASTGFHPGRIAAFDLRTGQVKWLAGPDWEREVTVVGLDEGGDEVIGYQAAAYGKPGRLIAVDTATHEVAPYMELPEGAGTGGHLWLYREHFFATTAKSITAFG